MFVCVARMLYKTLTWREAFERFVSGLSGFGRVRECLGVSVALFSGHCFLYVFASAYPFPAAVPGSGNLATTLTDVRLTPGSWRWGQGVVSEQLGSGKVGFMSGQSGQISLFWSLRLTSSTFPRCLFQVNADILSGVYSIPRALLRLRIACQRESGLTVTFSRQYFLRFGTVPLYH